MRVIKVADDIFKFAPEHCDGAAFWIGGGHLGLFWSAFLQCCEVAGCRFSREQAGIWQNTSLEPGGLIEGGLFRLRPKLEKLQFFYLHPNPSGAPGVESPYVSKRVRECLLALNSVGCRLVAMNGIQGIIGNGGCHSIEMDEKNNKQTIRALKRWQTNPGPTSLQRIYLVDLEGGFGRAEPENRKPY